MNTIKTLLLALIMILTSTVNAQEFNVYLSGGLSGKKHAPSQGKSDLKMGGNIGLGYTHTLNNTWNILTGIEMSLYRNNLNRNNYNYKNYTVDSKNSAFEYRLTSDTYSASSSFKSLNLPLMVQYKTKGDFPFYVNLGAKLLLPMNEDIEHVATNVELRGYYPDFNLELDNDPINGFGTIKKLNTETKNKLKMSVALSTELGTIINIKEQSNLYLGLYLDYGLTNINKETHKSTEKPIVNYNPLGLDKVKLNNNSSLFSSDNGVKILAFGIQLRYKYNKESKKQIIK